MELQPFGFDAYVDVDKWHIVKKDKEVIGKWVVEGYASTGDLDTQGDVITPEAIEMGAASLIKYNTVLFNHDPDRPIGIVEKAEAHDGKLFVKIVISKSEPKLWEQIKDGTLSKFSIRGKILDHEISVDELTKKEVLIIKAMELHEVSLVSVPANPEAKSLAWYVEKGYKDYLEKKSEKKPGETTQACVSRKIPILIREGKSRDQAAAIAFSMCGETKKYDELVEEFPWLKDVIDDMEKKDYPWDKCMADQKARGYSAERSAKICAAIKNRTISHMVGEWGLAKTEEEAINIVAHKMEEDPLYEYAWGQFLELQAINPVSMEECMRSMQQKGMPEDEAKEHCTKALNMGKTNDENDIQKDEKNLKRAMAAIESALASFDGEEKDQLMSIMRSLQALMGREYETEESAKSEGGKTVEKTEEKKEEQKMVAMSADALSEVIKQLQELVKEAKAQSEATKAQSDAVNATKGEIEKMVKDMNEVIKKIPVREATDTKEQENREHKEEKDAIKSLTEDEEYKKAKPADKLGRVLSAFFDGVKSPDKGGE